ncbi:hypothetical protein PBY51_007934 [Eleginops maclovinus]|uniref:Enamelin n=1 Tax=Eleginops maclovinus TaxID=56733 RepID=A0AAN7X8H9_ELEMC|nr:hypothetical protein PBY51_007934 [Eleginops maclovinus]
MALGPLFRVSWICLLLCDFTEGLPFFKGYGYRYYDDPRNMGNYGEEGGLNAVQSNGQAPSYQQTGSGSAKPQQNLQNTQGAPARELNKVGSTDWGQENLENPIEFPLSPKYPQLDSANSQQSPVQTQSRPSTNGIPAYPAGGFTRDAGEAAYEPAPTLTSEVATFPSFESWQPDPASGPNSANQNVNSGSIESGSRNIPHLVFEEVFQYPSKIIETSNTAGGYAQAEGKWPSTGSAPPPVGPSFPRNPTNEGAQPVQRDDEKPPKPVASPRKALAPQRLNEPIRQSYIIQSRNRYQQAKYKHSNTRYTPEFPSPIPVSTNGVAAQPAAPKM